MGIFSKRQVEKELEKNSNYIKRENLIHAIENVFHGNHSYVTEEEIGSKEIAEQ